MGSEFFINSQELEDKVRKLLPSQGGAGAGFDLSASTQIIPIIDLTESAEGSNLRQDIQSSYSFKSITEFNVNATTTDVINTTGFWRLHGTLTWTPTAGGTVFGTIQLFDGVSAKICWGSQCGYGLSPGDEVISVPFDFIVKLEAGETLRLVAPDTTMRFLGSVRQIADVNGALTNP